MIKDYQKNKAKELQNVLLSYSLAYLFGPPRVGKSLIAIETYNLVKNRLKQAGKCLILTKKNAIQGWQLFISTDEFKVINYEQIGKLDCKQYNFIIIDEAHNFSAYPKASQRMKIIKQFCRSKPILFVSGTPVIEGIHKLYSQLSLSSFSPFCDLTSYKFFNKYGISYKKYFNGRLVETYSKFNEDEILKKVKHLIVKVTFEEAEHNYTNSDKVIELSSNEVENFSKTIQKTNLFYEYLLENISAVNQALHRLCGGFYKDLDLPKPKIAWLEKFLKCHKNEKVCIMAYFTEEQEYLAKMFKSDYVEVLSSTKYCEGVDLSDYKHYILYSFGYSGAKFMQLRDRIVNINKKQNTCVIIPVLKNCLDKFIYETVSKKKDFNLKHLYKQEEE